MDFAVPETKLLKFFIYEIKPLGGVEDPLEQLETYIKAMPGILVLGDTPYFGIADDKLPLVGLRVSYQLTETGVIRYELSISPKGATAVMGSWLAVLFKMTSMNISALSEQIVTAGTMELMGGF